MSSFIDLCDSEEEDIENETIDGKFGLCQDDSSSSSSSSSDDDILNHPGLFSQASNSSEKDSSKVKNKNVGGTSKKMVSISRASSRSNINVYQDGSPQKPLTIDEGDDENAGEDSPPKSRNNNILNNDQSGVKRKRDGRLLYQKISSYMTLAKKSPSNGDIECIEIDLTSNEGSPKVSENNVTHLNGDDDDNDSSSSCQLERTINLSRSNGHEGDCHSRPLQNPQKAESEMKNSHKSFNDDINTRQMIPPKNEINSAVRVDVIDIGNNIQSKDDADTSDATSTTRPLSDKGTEAKARNDSLIELDLSIDTSEEDSDSDQQSNRHRNNSLISKSVQLRSKNNVSFRFGSPEIVEIDSDGDDDLNTKPPAAIVDPRPVKDETIHPQPKAANDRLKFNPLEDCDEFQHINVDSDGDSSSSSTHIPIFTPRPFKQSLVVDTSSSICRAAVAAARNSLSNPKPDDNMASDRICPATASSSPDLMTPRAFSPPSNSPLTTFAAKRKVPIPAIPAMPTELIKEIGGKLYPDLRHSFLVELASHARRLRHNSYERASFDAALRSIVVISLHLHPLRSPEAARRIKGVGGNFYELLKDKTSCSNAKAPFVPKKGKYSSVAAAALVALLELEEERINVVSAAGQSFSMEDLIAKINELLDSRASGLLNQTADKYNDRDNLDPGWGQVKKLCASSAGSELGGPFIKERKKKQACSSGIVFELLDRGRDIAIKLREFSKLGPSEPGPLRQLPSDTVDEEFGNVTMSMDHREGGGASKSLHKMCDQLDIRGVPYVVRELKIADYVFFIGDKLAPILIERKTADDVAGSLHDGRWERQQRSMRKAQYVLGDGEARRCQICYIIEGDPNKKKVHGGNVGRRTWFQSVDDVENAIGKLPMLGFSVMRSRGHLDTITILAKVAADVSWKAKNGIVDAKYTYQQFLNRVRVLSDEKGDPPMAREHQNPAPPVVTNYNNYVSKPTTSSPCDKDDGVNDAGITPAQSGEYQHDESEIENLKKLSISALKDLCKDRGEKIGGKKDELIARLMKPRKPEILILRMRRNEYVPKVPSSNAALMVALLLHHTPGSQGLSKERLMVLAEETGVSKESMSGDGGFYDGWSGMKLLQEGDPALVRREKGHRYSLTTQPPESSGVAVAHALHILAHRERLCTCGITPE